MIIILLLSFLFSFLHFKNIMTFSMVFRCCIVRQIFLSLCHYILWARMRTPIQHFSCNIFGMKTEKSNWESERDTKKKVINSSCLFMKRLAHRKYGGWERERDRLNFIWRFINPEDACLTSSTLSFMWTNT